MNPVPIIIGITGGSGCGKTSFATAIVNHFLTIGSVLISEDDYYLDTSKMEGFNSPDFDYDTPLIRNHDLLFSHLTQLKNGNTITKPIYDFTLHTISNKTENIAPQPLILVEGTHTLHNPKLREIFTIKIYVEADENIRFNRRLERDVKIRGRDPNDVEFQFFGNVKRGHEKWTVPTKQHADFIVNNGQNLAAICDMNKTKEFDMIIKKIMTLIAEN